MDLNLTQLKDLEYICEIAESYFEREYGLPKEQQWLERIRKYRELLHNEIRSWENSYFIYSYEHGAWWRPLRRGYTKDLEQAGRYDYLEARDICLKANKYSPQTLEKMVPLAEAANFKP